MTTTPIALDLTPSTGQPLTEPWTQTFADGETDVTRTVLPSGLRVLSQKVPATRSVGLSFWVPVGSRDELPQHGGSTHFLEHLLFKGTAKRSALDIAVAFDAVGGESNAATGKESTDYWARIQGEDLDMAVDVLADMLTSSRLDPADFDTERGVILDELAMGEDDPSDVVHEAFQLAVHGDTPLGRPVGGTPDIIRAVSCDDVWAHYRAHYAPDNLIVAAAGDVDHDRIVERVVAALEDSPWAQAMRAAATPRPRRSTEPVTPAGEGDVIRHRDVEQAHVIIGCPSMPGEDERRPVMSVLLSVLGGSMSSRLFQEIREKRGLAYTAYAFDAAYADAGAFGMYAGTSPRKVAEVERLMVAQLEDLASNGPTEEEIVRVRGQLRGGLALGLESTRARMSRLGRSEVHGKYFTVETSLARIEAVTAEQVRALAAELASAPRRRALVLPRA